MAETGDKTIRRPATSNSPGRSPGGMPLTIHLDEREYAALVRIARHRETTASRLVERLVLHALSRADVPPGAESHPSRPHTPYDEAVRGFIPDDRPDPTLEE